MYHFMAGAKDTSSMAKTQAVKTIYILTVVLLGCVASRSVIGWRLPPSNSTQITDVALTTAIRTSDSCYVSDAPAGDNCWHCYRLHYPRRTAQYIVGVEPARKVAQWRLVIIKTKCRRFRQLHGATTSCPWNFYWASDALAPSRRVALS